MISSYANVSIIIEINTSIKTKPAVSTTDKLLALFVQHFGLQAGSELEARTITKPDGSVELCLKTNGREQRLRVIPGVAPSRKLLLKEATSGQTSTLFLAPHFPDSLAADLRRSGINHADLNGRLFIRTPFFLLDRGPRNGRFRNPGPKINPFSLKSSRVVRVLFSHRQGEWSQVELEERTGVSRALISLTLTELINRELVEQTQSGNRDRQGLYRLKDFDRTLDEWKEEDDWRKRTTVHQFSVLAGDLVEIAETAQTKLGSESIYFTQWFAAQYRHPYTTPPLVSAYVKKGSLLKLREARPVDDGGNLWLIEPRDEGVFQETQTVAGFNFVSDVQIYLDLLPMGLRGPDQAEALRAWEGFSK